MPVGRFIVGVAALVHDPAAGKYLLLRRSREKDVGAGSWECPTGRVDQGESIEAALVREVWEELGVAARPRFILGTTHFFRGEVRPENELVSVLYACTIDDPAAVRIGPEHDEVRWMTREAIADFLPERHWIHWVIERAKAMEAGMHPALQARLLEEGFEVTGRVM
ncbi:MAG TPA: NUDIX domain-containing protein [Anaerolineales bacterium]|nr:NUDIX domain-containing protein [Anaerolineales bacterium]